MTEDRGLVAATRQSFEKARHSRTTFCLLSSVLCLLMTASIGYPQADPMTAAQAFAEGKALGQGATGAAAGNITNGTIANTVNSFNPQYYQYSTTAPETQYFQGGNGDTHTPGANKITSCANDPANPDKFLQQNCDAISYMAQNPTTRPQFTINPNDPMILNSRQITANAGTLAAQSLGFADPSAMGSFTACQTTTTSTSPTYTTEVCNEYLSSTTNMCIVGRDVVVDAQSNFQCNETANAYQTSTCDKTLNVTVTQPQPIAATPNYSCPAGQTLSGTTCVQPTIAASVNYSCTAVNLPACTHYGNSKLLVWHRTDAFRNLMRDTCGQRYAQLFLPIWGRAVWNELHSGSDICKRQLLLPIRKHLVWLNVPSTGLSACGGGGDCNNYTKCRVCRPTLWEHS